MCKKLLFLLLTGLFIFSTSKGQSLTNYNFAATAGTFTVISGTVPGGTGNVDEGFFNSIPIGFDFWYMGTRYTTVSSSTNGWLALGGSITNATPVNNLSNGGSPRPILAPLWDDLSIGAQNNVTYLTSGASGSRIFTIQFLNSLWQSNANGDNISYQVKMYESTGKVEFCYRAENGNLKTPSASIGITGTAVGSGNYLSLSSTGTNPSPNSTLEYNNLSTKPATGQLYAFTSPVPLAPSSLTFSNVSASAMSLNWVDNSNNETTFAIYRSTDGVTYSYVFQTGANATTAYITGLSGSTNYYWKVYAVTEGALSPSLNGTQATPCVPPAIRQIPATGLVSDYSFNGNALDATGNNNGTFQNTPILTTDRFGISSKAYSFNGTNQYMSTSTIYTNPSDFSLSVWFKTNTISGGNLFGFGNTQTGQSSNYDRQIYMNNAGQIYFGIYPGSVVTVNSASSYNDNAWHLVTATLSSTAGMNLYIDGLSVGSNTTVTAAQNYSGYWKAGFGNLTGWPSMPSGNYFNGILDDILVYNRALNAGEISTLFTAPDGAGNSGPVCAGTTLSLSATTIGGASYLWTGPNGYTSAVQNPGFVYASSNAGLYTLQVTAAGCTATAYTTVKSTATNGQWTGASSTNWADVGNWCSGVVPTATSNVIISATATRMPDISGNASCNNLTINAGATVTTSATGNLSIAGLLTNNGTMINNGTTTFNGTSGQQTFAGVTSFNNITLNNSNGLLLPAAITLNNLTLTSGSLNANNFNCSVSGNWINNASASAFAGGTSTINFNGTGAQNIGGTFTTTFPNITIANTVSTVSLSVNTSITSNLTVSAGIFDLGSFTANRATVGGTLFVANNATLKIGGSNSYPENYATSSLIVGSTVEYGGTNQVVANMAYGNLKLSSSSGNAIKTLPTSALTVLGNLVSVPGAGTSVSYTAASNITVSGNVSIDPSTTFNAAGFAHNIGGNWVNNGIFNGNTGTVTFTGSAASVSGTGAQHFNHLTVAAPFITFSANTISLSGNLATSNGGSFTQATGGTLVMSGTGTTLSGSGISPDNFTVSGSVSTASSFFITGNLVVSGSLTATAGAVTMSGTTKTISGSGLKSFYNLFVTGTISTINDFSIAAALTVNGSLTATAGTGTFTGSSTLSGTSNLFDVTVNGTSLQLASGANLGIAGTLNITAGLLNVTNSIPNTVNFNGNGPQNINAIAYHNLSFSTTGNKTAVSSLTVFNDITIGTGTIFVPGSYSHHIYNDWLNNGSFTAGNSTIILEGNITSNISGATTFNNLTVNSTTSATGVLLHSNITVATLNMTQGTMLTGTNTVTITDTRTGNGIILGNIQRTHAFTTGIAYAFEGPDNSINFSSVSGVTSITVSVVKGSISDFPFGGSISRVYTISVPAGTYTGTLRLHYEDAELNGNTESSMALWNYNNPWAAIGKTANNTISNYVEQSGLTNISNRWTCSDNANVVQWNGSVSSDWNTAANWTVLQGAASAPPTAADIVNLGTSSFTNQPTISSTVTVKNIIFGSTQAVTLSLASGGTLTSSDIHGAWTGNTTHTINTNNQVITVNGDMTLSDGTTGHAINLNIGTGTVNVKNLLSQSGGASLVFTGAGNLNIGEDYLYSNGVFTAGTGTVTYNGILGQLVGGVSYNHLVVNKTAGAARIENDLTVNGDLTISSGELTNTPLLIVKGNVTIATAATLQNTGAIHVGGNWANSGNFIGLGLKVLFNGAGTQTISASTFNNLEFNKPSNSIVELTGNVILKGNLAGIGGIVDIKSFFFNREVVGGTATISDSATLIFGANNAPDKFANYALSSKSTIIFNGSDTQHLYLPGLVYGNVVFRNSGIKMLYTPITVMGNFTIENGASFNAGSNTISLNGNWVNAGTFIPGTSTLVCTGTTKTFTGVTTFNKATINGSYTFLDNATFNGLLNITSTGSLNGGSTISCILHSDLINSGSLYNLGATTFSGNVEQTLSLINAVRTVAITVNFNGSVSPILNSTSAPQFGYLNINNTGGVNPSVGWTVLYGMTVGAGASFNGGNFSHRIYGNLTNNGTMSTADTLSFLPSTAASIGLGTDFSSTGRVYFGGAGAITLSGNLLSFNHVNINNTHASGINPASNWMQTKDLTVAAGSILNAGSNTYTVAGNIFNTGTINSGTSTFILNGAGSQEINTVSPFHNLTLNKPSGGAFLSLNTAVNGILNFITGSLKTGAYAVTQPAGGTVSGASSSSGWVNGQLQKNISTGTVEKTFEIGDSVEYTPVQLSFTGVTTSGNLTVNTTAGDHPDLQNSPVNASRTVNRYWTLQNNNVQFSNYSAIFNFVSSDVDAGASTSLFSVVNHNGSSWIIPVTESPNLTNTKATGLTTFMHFLVGEICNKGTAISYAGSPYCTNGGAATVTLTGNGGGIFSSDTGLSINAATGEINLSLSTTGVHTVTYAVAASGDCGEFITSTIIKIGTAGEWTGAVNTDWTNAANWSCGGIPTSITDVMIPSGLTNYPVMEANTAIRNLTVATGGSLIANNITLQVSGELANSGTADFTSGTLELNGSSEQVIPTGFFAKNTVQNLIINNAVALTGADTLTGTLTLRSGKTFTTNDNLSLKSTATGTARIAALPVDGTGTATAFINGKVSVERFIPLRKAWRLLSAPVRSSGSPTINEAWQEGLTTASANTNLYPGYGVFIQGGTVANGFDQGPTTSPFLKVYNNASNSLVGLPAVPGTNAAIASYPGYFLYIRGDRSINLMAGTAAAITQTTLRIKGNVNTGNITTAVNAANLTLLGNPYPSAIDFQTITKSNVKNGFYVWDPKISGAYGLGGYVTFSWNSGTGSYDATSSVSPVSQYIPSGEAVFIESADGATPGSVTIKEADKTANGSDQVFGRYTGLAQKVRVNLLGVNSDASTSLLDGVLTTYHDDNANSVDGSDAKKLNGGSENIGIKRTGTMLAIERRTTITAKDTTFLNIYQMKVQGYQLHISAENMDASNTVAVIKDKYNATVNNMTLNMNGTTVIPFSITSDPASYAIDRFSIVFGPVEVLPVTFTRVKAFKKDNTVVVEWEVSNEINIKQYEVERSLDGSNFAKLNTTIAKGNAGNNQYSFTDVNPRDGNNYYRIRAVEQNNQYAYSEIVKVLMPIKSKPATIVVYPNPVEGNTIAIQCKQMIKGTYVLRLFNTTGHLIASKTLQLTEGNSLQLLEVNQKFAAGKYELVIKGEGVELSTPVLKR
jgi:Concanavalin A-like lectin/glucanases superfamily